MKAFLTFIIGIFIGASGMYYVFQNSLQENMDTLLTTTLESVQNHLSEQADKIDLELNDNSGTTKGKTTGSELTGSSISDTKTNVDKDVVNKLIDSQKEEISRILETQKEKIKVQLEGSIKEYLNNKLSEIFGK